MSHPWTRSRTPRTCLRCQKKFRSRSIANRICGVCHDILEDSRAAEKGHLHPAKMYTLSHNKGGFVFVERPA